jgi:hypothetical protein
MYCVNVDTLYLMKKSKHKKLPKTSCFMHLRCDPQFKSLLTVEARAEGRTLSNYIFELIHEARKARHDGYVKARASKELNATFGSS